MTFNKHVLSEWTEWWDFISSPKWPQHWIAAFQSCFSPSVAVKLATGCEGSVIPGLWCLTSTWPRAELDSIPAGRPLLQDKDAVPRSKAHTGLPTQKPAGKMQERQSGCSVGPALWIKNNSWQNEEVETIWRLKKKSCLSFCGRELYSHFIWWIWFSLIRLAVWRDLEQKR